MADYQDILDAQPVSLQEQLAGLSNWLRGNSDQLVDATKPAMNFRGVPSREKISAAREATANNGPTFLSPEWFAKLYGQKSADANAVPTVPAAVPDTVPASVAPALPPAPARRSSRPALAPQTPPALSPMEFQGMPPAAEPEQMPNLSPAEFQGMPPAAPATPRQSYVDMFKEFLAQKQEPLKAPLTEEQQRDLKLKFYLSLMNQPRGTGLIQGAGAAGEQALAAKQGLLKENMTQAEKARAVQMETANKLLGVRNLEDDNAARERQLGITEKHYGDQASHNKRLEDLKQKELEIMQKYREGQYETAKERAEAAGRLADIKGQMATLRGQMAQMDPFSRTFESIMAINKKYGINESPAETLNRLKPPRFVSQDDQVGVDAMGSPVYKKKAYNAVTGEPMTQGAAPIPTIPPPPAAIQMLRQKPELAGAFDAKYGAGAAKAALGQ